MTALDRRAARLACYLVAVLAASPAAAQEGSAGWVGLQSVAAGWKATVSFDPLTGTGHVCRGEDLVGFALDLPLYRLGDGKALRAPAVRDLGGTLQVATETVAAIEAWFRERDAERASRFRVVAILLDPGHGGKDPGAIGEHGAGRDRLRLVEKDLVLSIANDVLARLRQRWPDRIILTTRAGDTYPTLDDRVLMANDIDLSVNEAIIYVSIHANASFNRNAAGYEVWYLNPEYRRTVMDPTKSEGVNPDVLPILNSMLEEEYTMESVFLAKSVLDGLSGALGDATISRGLRAEEWFVVRNARMPSILIEVGFVTNEDEARLLSQPEYLRKLGDGIYTGIVSFVDYFETRKGIPAP